MGVVTTAEVEEGQVFGPIPMTLTLADPSVLIGHRTCDTPPDIHAVKLDINAYKEGSGLGEWVPYVQAAREFKEQNMEAFMGASGELFYRCIRRMAANSELFIWYSDQYAAHMGVPPILPAYIKGSSFVCPYCAEIFAFSNSLRAHLRFKCKYRHHFAINQKAASAPLNCVVPSSKSEDRGVSPSKASPPQYKNPESPHSSTAGSNSPSRSPLPAHSLKRPREAHGDTPDRSPKRQTCSPKSDTSDKPSPPIQTDETRSAFQRVDRFKKSSPEPPVPPAPSNHNQIQASPVLRDPGPPLMHHYQLLASQRLPMAMLGGKLGIPSFSKKEPEMLKPYENNNRPIHANLPFSPTDLTSLPQGVPYVYRSPNPMVDRMLNAAPVRTPIPPSLGLAQNWCAKCNATFRMTSDLVYHMRSHHKREFDPVKKKRDDKLKCEICGETFRERHHLTRHMTSHA